MKLAVAYVFWYMAFIMLRWFPLIPSLFFFFTMKVCWILSHTSYALIAMTMWSCPSSYVLYHLVADFFFFFFLFSSWLLRLAHLWVGFFVVVRTLHRCCLFCQEAHGVAFCPFGIWTAFKAVTQYLDRLFNWRLQNGDIPIVALIVWQLEYFYKKKLLCGAVNPYPGQNCIKLNTWAHTQESMSNWCEWSKAHAFYQLCQSVSQLWYPPIAVQEVTSERNWLQGTWNLSVNFL